MFDVILRKTINKKVQHCTLKWYLFAFEEKYQKLNVEIYSSTKELLFSVHLQFLFVRNCISGSTVWNREVKSKPIILSFFAYLFF